MAIKITGTTVINDSREFENLTDLNNIIKKPSVTSPTDNETDTDFSDLTITGTPYNAVYDNRDYREFEVDLATGDFSSPVVSQQVNSDSLTLSVDLASETEHKVRIRDVDLDGTVGPFSDVVNFTTEVNPLAVASLGDSISGGFYMGTVCAAGTCYYLIVAPNATGCACCQWKTSRTFVSNPDDLFDGYGNTYTAFPGLDNPEYPAANFTATRTIGGFSDWYLPAFNEIEVFYNNGGGAGSGDPLPSGEDFVGCGYWSSTNSDAGSCLVYARRFQEGGTGTYFVDYFYPVRAVRRVPV